jgi:tRNA (adenine57-N1/adenine58-N1)-methyltransferase
VSERDSSSSAPTPLVAGEQILLIDSKDRRRLVRLSVHGQTHTHSGTVEHDHILDQPEGCEVRGSAGSRYLAVRPTLADRVLAMPRGAQIIYPKDLAAILMAADIHPGVRVLEAGVGSGALAMALARAGAQVVGYERRAEFAAVAAKNLAGAGIESARYQMVSSDVYDGIAETDLDRVILDLPEPWRVIPHAEKSLRPGGILVTYLPSINQVMELHEALGSSRFGLVRTHEVLERGWHLEGRSVRPEHRMVAHTAFLTTARLLVSNGPW